MLNPISLNNFIYLFFKRFIELDNLKIYEFTYHKKF